MLSTHEQALSDPQAPTLSIITSICTSKLAAWPRAEAEQSCLSIDTLNRKTRSRQHCLILAVYQAAWGILVPWPGVKPVSSAVEAQSSNHWTTRKVPRADFLKVGSRGKWGDSPPPKASHTSSTTNLQIGCQTISKDTVILQRYYFSQTSDTLMWQCILSLVYR